MAEADPYVNQFPDDPWEYPYAAHRAFCDAQRIEKKLAILAEELGEGHPDADPELLRAFTAWEDFHGFSNAFNFARAHDEQPDFVLHPKPEDLLMPFTAFFVGTVRSGQLPEARRLLSTFSEQLGAIATGVTSEVTLTASEQSVRSKLFEGETLAHLRKSLLNVFKEFVADPRQKSAATLGRNALLHQGLKTFGDMVAVGKEDIVDIRNFGPRCQQVAELLMDNYPALQPVWREGDRLRRAAMLYDSPSEIPSYLVRNTSYGLLNYSVGQILTMDLRDLARAISPGNPRIPEAQRFHEKAIDFEAGFNRTRLRLLQEQGEQPQLRNS